MKNKKQKQFVDKLAREYKRGYKDGKEEDARIQIAYTKLAKNK